MNACYLQSRQTSSEPTQQQMTPVVNAGFDGNNEPMNDASPPYKTVM